jgi:hypothetical protein
MANRSGREGAFLKASERESLLRQFARFERRKRQIVVDHLDPQQPDEDGCRVCEKDNDHTNMLLCERCSAEYHFYCIGLKTVPNEDWFCGTFLPEDCGLSEHLPSTTTHDHDHAYTNPVT